ncbi:hypothetical protein BT093_11820 [Corynebacterium diphtheriae]|nr:hypothetical protein BT093_11820 [Corynebacterium diphtheriae]
MKQTTQHTPKNQKQKKTQKKQVVIEKCIGYAPAEYDVAELMHSTGVFFLLSGVFVDFLFFIFIYCCLQTYTS